jgi:hypothetical protein
MENWNNIGGLLMSEIDARTIIYSRTPIDYITHTYKLGNGAWEFAGKAGEDILTFRVYQDGSVTER